MTEMLWQLPAVELARRYRERSLSPVDVAQACLARLEEVNPRLNAVVARRDGAFLDEARASARRFEQGQPLSLLDGIPLTVKDSLYTVDQPTTWGTRALKDHCTGQDELAVAARGLRAHPCWQDQRARVCAGGLHRQPLVRPHGITDCP